LGDTLGVEVIFIRVAEPKHQKRWKYRQMMAAIIADEGKQTSPDSATTKP
jgi:hypothetical protein